MKNLLVLITGLFLSLTCLSQPCLPDGIVFSTQNEIDHFHFNNPDCFQIQGDVTIAGDNITNLDSLYGITSIAGSLYLGKFATATGNPDLSSISGLGSLTTIGGNLSIYSNGSLTSIAGFNKLTYIRGYLDIYENTFLTDLTGLNNVSSVGDYLLIQDNPSLTSLSGLDQTTQIGGDLSIVHNIALTSIMGLGNIDAGTIVNLQILDNTSLSTCAVKSICDYLSAPNGTIQISNNKTGCSNQTEVEAACVALPVERIACEKGFSIFPNPSFDYITLETKNTSTEGKCSILNMQGQELMKYRLTEHKTQLDISNLGRGVYLLRLINDSTVREEKIIKL